MSRPSMTSADRRAEATARANRIKLRQQFTARALMAPTNHAFCVAITPPGADAQRSQQIRRRSI